MVKKVISVVLVSVFLSLTLSGCADFVKSMLSYWEGMSKSEARELIEGELEGKYSEEFSVLNTYKRGGDGFTYLLADCSPKSSSDIVFEIESFEVGGGYIIRDNYIQNVVRKQLKQKIDDVLKENYENFASQVFVTPLNYWYDSGIRSANNATIKNFSESFTDDDDNYTLVYIAIKNSEKDFDKIKNALQKMSDNFYSLNVSIDCYYTDEQTIEQCKENMNKSFREMGMDYILESSEFEKDEFVYFNDDRGLTYISKKD